LTKPNSSCRVIVEIWIQFDDRRIVEFNDSTSEVQILCDDEWVVWCRDDTMELLTLYLSWLA